MKNRILTLTVMAMMVFVAIPLEIPAEPAQAEQWKTNQAIDFVACSFVQLPHRPDVGTCDESTMAIGLLIEKIEKLNAQETLNLLRDFEKVKTDVKSWKTDQVYYFLNDYLFLSPGRYPSISKFLEKRKGSDDLSVLKKDIEQKLRERFFEPIAQKADSTQPSSPSTAQPTQVEDGGVGGENDDRDARFFRFMSWDLILGFVIGGVFAVLGVVTFQMIRGGRKGRSSSHDRAESSGFGGDRPRESSQKADRRPNIPNTPTSLGREKQLLEKIRELEDKLIEKQKDLDSLNASTPIPEVSAGYSVPIEPPQPNQVETSVAPGRSLFFPAPTFEGVFDSRYASPVKNEGESLYILKLVSEVEAEVHLDNSKIAFNKARHSPERILDPVCDGQRSPLNKIIGIKMTAPGKARLEGDNWRVYEKVKLTYDY